MLSRSIVCAFIHSSYSVVCRQKEAQLEFFVLRSDLLIVKMFMSYEVIATFGISAILSFSLSAVVLLVIAAKRGLLRIGKRKPLPFHLTQAVLEKKAQVGSPLLVAPSAPPLHMVVELTPLNDRV